MPAYCVPRTHGFHSAPVRIHTPPYLSGALEGLPILRLSCRIVSIFSVMLRLAFNGQILCCSARPSYLVSLWAFSPTSISSVHWVQGRPRDGGGHRAPRPRRCTAEPWYALREACFLQLAPRVRQTSFGMFGRLSIVVGGRARQHVRRKRQEERRSAATAAVLGRTLRCVMCAVC